MKFSGKLFVIIGAVVSCLAIICAIVAFFDSEDKKKKNFSELKRYLNDSIL